MKPVPLTDLARAAAARGDTRSRSLARLRSDLLNSRTWSSHGVAIVEGLPFEDEVTARRCVHTISAALGRLLPQDNNGELVREVRYRGVTLGEGATARYSDSRDGGQLHTDGPHRPDAAPDWFALMCVRQAEIGGHLMLVSTSQILTLLSKDVIAALERPFLFDQREEGSRPVKRPILREVSAGRWHVNYLRKYIELGHRHPSAMPLTDIQVGALDRLDEVVNTLAARPSTRTTLKLAPGQMVLVDNRRLLHGRTAFRTDAAHKDRLMLRAWISPERPLDHKVLRDSMTLS